MTQVNKLSDNVQKILYDMGWTSLRPIQEKAIDAIMDTNKHVILAANTASGKTEAAFLPILSLIENMEGCTVLYVAPLKTLLNNQHERIIDLTRHTDYTVMKWHGDVPYNLKQKFRKEPDTILQITPESFENFLMNYNHSLPKLFGNVQFIVIDEFHYFLESDRGYQLRSQIYRLEKYLEHKPRMVLLSATIQIDDAVLSWIDNDHNNIAIVEDTQKRKNLNVSYYDFTKDKNKDNDSKDYEENESNSDDESFIEARNDYQKDAFYQDVYDVTKDMKSIIFMNRKSALEELTFHLNQMANEQKYLIHHGSLHKEIREQAEKEMISQEGKNIAATSTLELGVDIGDVDCIVQVNENKTVSGLKQRVGRAGRKGQDAYFQQYTNDGFARQTKVLAMMDLLQTTFVEETNLNPKPYHILFHQTLSYIKENVSLSVQDYKQFVKQNPVFKNFTDEDIKKFLIHLERTKMIEFSNNEMYLYVAGERIVDNYEFYSVFVSNSDFSVINHLNQKIGMMNPENIAMGKKDNKQYIILAGKLWQVVGIDSKTKQISVKPSLRAREIRFSGTYSDEIHHVVAGKMLELLNEYREDSHKFSIKYPYINDNVLKYVQIESKEFPMIPFEERVKVLEDENVLIFYCFLGTRMLNVFCSLLEQLQCNYQVDFHNQKIVIAKSSLISEFEELLNFMINESFDYDDLILDKDSKLNNLGYNEFKFMDYLTVSQQRFLLNYDKFNLNEWHKYKHLLLNAYQKRILPN